MKLGKIKKQKEPKIQSEKKQNPAPRMGGEYMNVSPYLMTVGNSDRDSLNLGYKQSPARDQTKRFSQMQINIDGADYQMHSE